MYTEVSAYVVAVLLSTIHPGEDYTNADADGDGYGNSGRRDNGWIG